MIQTVIASAGMILYTWASADLAKNTDDSWIKSSLGGLHTEILGSAADRFYEIAKRKIKERFPNLITENKKTLLKAVRRSQLKAIRDACYAYRAEIKGTPSEKYNLAELKQVESYISDQEKSLSKDFSIDNKSLEALTIDERIINTQIPTLQKSLFNELPKAETLPVRLKEMIENGWTENNISVNLFQRINDYFAEELEDTELANLFHTQLLNNISFTLNDLVGEQANQTAKINDIAKRIEERANELERLGYRILYEDNNGKCKGLEFIGKKLDRIEDKVDEIKESVAKMNATLEGKRFNEPIITYGLRNLNVKVYGRDIEKDTLLKALCGETDEAKAHKFALIVAPSGFGKSFVLQKVLQDVYDEENRIIKPDYEAKVKQILLIDCRLKKTLNDVVGDFNELLGTQELYEEKFDALNFSHQLVQLAQDKVWLILDNFESWLDEDYKIINAGLRAFLNALFEINHKLRGVFLSQSEPETHFQNKLNELENVGKELLNGLPEDVAINYLQTEGKDVGLDKVDKSLLIEFLNRVARIPQALPSLIDYLKLKKKAWQAKGKTFADFINDTKIWKSFDEYEEHQSEDIHIRRTKALIKAQIEVQSDDIKLIMKAITFFDREVPYQSLEVLFEDEDKAEEVIKRFSEHKIAFERTGIRGTIYYDLHPYFRDVVLKELSPVDTIATKDYGKGLFNKGLAESSKKYFNRSVSIYGCAEKLFEHLIVTSQTELANNLAAIYVNKGSSLTSLRRLSEAIIELEKGINIFNSLIDEGRVELVNKLASAYISKGGCLIDLGRPNEAIIELEKAIKIFNPSIKFGSVESNYILAIAYLNMGVSFSSLRKFKEAITEQEKAIEILNSLINSGATKLSNNLALSYLNKGVALASLGKLNEAIIEYEKTIQIRQLLVETDHPELAEDLARTYLNKSITLKNLGDLTKSIIELEKAINIFESLVEEGRTELAEDLARSYLNKGIYFEILGKLSEAIIELEKAINIFKSLIDKGNNRLSNDLASTYLNKGVALASLGRLNEAIIEYEKAIEIRKLLVESDHPELAEDLASTYLSKGNTLDILGKSKEAITDYDKAIEIFESLINEGRTELNINLARVYLNKSVALTIINVPSEAFNELEKAIQILESLVKNGRLELTDNLAGAYMNRGNWFGNQGKFSEAIIEYEKTIEIFKSLILADRSELTMELAGAYLNKGNTLEQLGESAQAVENISEAINLLENQLQSRGLHILPNYAKALWVRVNSLIRIENWAMIAADAVKILVFIPTLQSNKHSDEFKHFVRREIGIMFRQIKGLSPENRANVYQEANLIGQQQEEPIPFGDYLKQNIDAME